MIESRAGTRATGIEVGDRPTVLLAAALAQRPHHGGHTWAVLQYVLGLERLGYEVIVVDHLTREMLDGRARLAPELSDNAAFFSDLMRTRGLEASHCLLIEDGTRTVGMPRAALIAAARRSVLLLNVMGYLRDREVFDACPLRAFLDIDPGFSQMWHTLGLHDAYAGHDRFVTLGLRVGLPDCEIPTCGLDWITTVPPVVLGEWPFDTNGAAKRVGSVVTWRGPYDPVELDGIVYGLRVHEFRTLATLPRRASAEFELVLDIEDGDRKDRVLLETAGWRLREPAVTRCVDSFRSYVRGSRAEFMVAKGMYVRSRSGWFSERSACYLAAGRPVIAQDTGWSAKIPPQQGLLAYRSLDEAVAALAEIDADYEAHRRGARAVAERHFDSDIVLRRLLDALAVA